MKASKEKFYIFKHVPYFAILLGLKNALNQHNGYDE